ncbi:hypothetical protein F4677DRAFT_449010 [Hypoxylon crocopeplum]|nr:hypothetical protein F4677DRAFT_449010 [Hypoxylon crocopeplum]
MPIDVIVSTILKVAESVIPPLIDAISNPNGNAGLDAPLISGPTGKPSKFNTNYIPRVNLTERNDLDAGPCGVPQYNFDMCRDALRGLTITHSVLAPGREGAI